jgi:hypothetical protein
MLMPSRSRTRVTAALVLGEREGCTQPSSISMRRLCLAAGRGLGVIVRAGIFCLMARPAILAHGKTRAYARPGPE